MNAEEAYAIADCALQMAGKTASDFATARGINVKTGERQALLLKDAEACAVLSFGKSTFYEMLEEDPRLQRCRVRIRKGMVRYSPGRLEEYRDALVRDADEERATND